MINTILIATDFSVSANQAALYTCKLLRDVKPRRVILFHALEPNRDRILLTDLLAPDEEILKKEKEVASVQLGKSLERLRPELNSSTHFETRVETDTLLNSIQRVVKEQNIDLVVIGISGKGNQSTNIIGSNTLKLMRSCPAPLLVVPIETEFIPVHRIVLAWDHKDTRKTLPVAHLTKLVQSLLAKLYVVYIDNNAHQSAADILTESRDLNELLFDLTPEVHSPKQASITDGILEFTKQHDAQLMVLVPKKSSFLEDFFTKRATEKIALRTQIPMIIMRNI